jgi:WD40 repeat protein
MQRKGFTLLPVLVAVWLGIISGCRSEEPTGSVQLMGRFQQALAASDVTRVAVTVTAPYMSPRTSELVKADGQWSGTLEQLPAGEDRTFTAEAFGAVGTKLYEGTVTDVTITPGKTVLVALTLQQVGAPPPFVNAVPVIDALLASASAVAPGERITLKATAHDPNPGEVLTYAWTASVGALGSPSSATTTWTAPAETGLATLTLAVTDAHGSSTTLSLALPVRNTRGSADVDVSLNTWPQVARIVATPSRVNVGEPTTVVATAMDSDGDSLAYTWSASGCTGTWTGASSATVGFTPDAPPPGGSCDCRLGVKVEDGRGGQALGTLAICVGASPTPLFAPNVVGYHQSATTVSAGGTVTLRLAAEDAQGSTLGFSWAASAGTLGSPTSTASTSEVLWTAPTCANPRGAVSLTATVGNALGASTSHTFIVTGLPDCLPPDSWSVLGGMRTRREYHTATLLPSGQVLMIGGPPSGDMVYSLTEVYDPEARLSVSAGTEVRERFRHTATLLPSGKVLVVGGHGTLDAAALYEPATGTWTEAGIPGTRRAWHTATLLPSGKVLVAGGYDASGGEGLATAEVYDPATGTWSPTASMAVSRVAATATLLPSGKVLVTGGSSIGDASKTAEVYDPAKGTWSPTSSMTASHGGWHTATLLPSGKVLVAGGDSSATEVYDPATGAWNPTGAMAAAREQHTATPLLSGKVLVTGGSVATAEVYDPATGTWSPAGALAEVRRHHTATLLPSGRVLVAGGTSSSTAVEVYDPETGTWTFLGAPMPSRSSHTATLLPSGKVLVAGGGGSSTAHVYDPTSRTWSPTGAMTVTRSGHTATLLPSGKVLVAGGGGSSTAEVYDPATGAWSPTGAMAAARGHHTATLLPSGKVLVAGGGLATAEVYDPVTGTWSPAGTMGGVLRERHTATLLLSGKVLVVGGTGVDSNPVVVEIYDPVTGRWSLAGAMARPRLHHTATLLPSGKVLVAGGQDRFGSVSLVELYDPETETWTEAGASSYQALASATLLPSGKVWVVGGYMGFNWTHLYDPATGTWSSKEIDFSFIDHTATLLPSGQVLMVGGMYSSGAQPLAFLYTP